MTDAEVAARQEFDLEEEWSSLQPLEEWANTPLSALLVDRSPDLG